MIFLTFGHNIDNFLPFLVSSPVIEVTGKQDSGLWNQKHPDKIIFTLNLKNCLL